MPTNVRVISTLEIQATTSPAATDATTDATNPSNRIGRKRKAAARPAAPTT
jgi:hypothetical protein